MDTNNNGHGQDSRLVERVDQVALTKLDFDILELIVGYCLAPLARFSTADLRPEDKQSLKILRLVSRTISELTAPYTYGLFEIVIIHFDDKDISHLRQFAQKPEALGVRGLGLEPGRSQLVESEGHSANMSDPGVRNKDLAAGAGGLMNDVPRLHDRHAEFAIGPTLNLNSLLVDRTLYSDASRLIGAYFSRISTLELRDASITVQELCDSMASMPCLSLLSIVETTRDGPLRDLLTAETPRFSRPARLEEFYMAGVQVPEGVTDERAGLERFLRQRFPDCWILHVNVNTTWDKEPKAGAFQFEVAWSV